MNTVSDCLLEWNVLITVRYWLISVYHIGTTANIYIYIYIISYLITYKKIYIFNTFIKLVILELI